VPALPSSPAEPTVNHLTNGHLPTALRPFLHGALFHGLRKNNGDLRPTAVGCTYRRLVAKDCLRPYISRLYELLQPSQVGVGTLRGSEAAVHATCSFMAQTQGEKVLLKLDVRNAFNSIRLNTVLQAAQTHLPEIYPFIWDCYSSKSSLFHGDFCFHSATGVQQGGPPGPALFALAIHGVTSEVKSDLNVWYLGDDCIGGDPQTVLSKAAFIRNGLSSVGLEINNSKCELLIVNHTTSQERSQTIKLLQDVFPSISITAPNIWQLLGSPLHQDSAPLHLEAKTKMLDNIIGNLELIEPHQAFFVLKNVSQSPNSLLTAKCTMLQVQRGTEGVRHSHKNQHGKNMQCVFWRRKLVKSIPTNQTCRPGPSFRGRPVC